MLLLTNLKRDKKTTLGALITLPDGSVSSKSVVEIYFPKFFHNTVLYSTENGVTVCGFIMIKVGKSYAALRISTMMELGDNGKLTEVMMDNGEGISSECFCYTFEAGSVIFKSLNLVVYGNVVYPLTYKIHKRGGKIPYFTKNDFLTCLDNIPFLNGVDVPFYGYLSVYGETCCRSPKDLDKPARLTNNDAYVNVAFSAILYSIDNSLSLIAGNYTEDGFQKALTTTTDRASAFEEVLRI